MRSAGFLYPVLLLGLLTPGIGALALSIVHPATSEVVAAGDDYATQVLGNAWDMTDPVDIDTEESVTVSNQAYGDGIFSGDTSAGGAYIYPLFMGYPDSINSSRGAAFPIDTSHYRYVTIKIRATQPATEFTRVVFLEKDSGSYADNTFGFSQYMVLPADQWKIITADMISQIEPTSPHLWTDFPKVMGLRIDPANGAGVHFDIDWIRLTSPASAAQKYTVQWTDSGAGPYTLTAVDSDGVSYPLGTAVSGTSYPADLTFLAPGQYTIVVARSGASASSGVFTINTPPQFAMTAPSARGEQSQNFAQTVVGNPWGPIQATDLTPINFKNVVYNNPVGSFYGRPTSLDPEWFLDLGSHTIDTKLYRSLCFTQEVFGVRDLSPTGGSVARVFWGSPGALTTSQNIVLDDNRGDTVVSEYCIPDLAAVPLETNPPQNGGTWSGTKTAFRVDPDEFTPPNGCNTPDTCHDVRLDSVVLSPFAHANPSYTFSWNLSASDEIFHNGFEAGGSTMMLALALDPDTTPGNANEIAITTLPLNSGVTSFAWPGSGAIAPGTYHVLATVNDGVNVVNQYAGGVIVVNQP
jgi:hypothetical protein